MRSRTRQLDLAVGTPRRGDTNFQEPSLPDGWAWTNLGDVTAERVDQGGPDGVTFTYVDISSVDNARKAITEAKMLSSREAPSRARQRLAAGDVLVSMTRPNLNAVAMVPPHMDGAIGSTGFHVLRSSAAVAPMWLYLVVQSSAFVEAMSSLVQGALYPAVRPKDIRSFRIPLPPIAEQRRIVAAVEEHLSSLDNATSLLHRAAANLHRLQSAALRAAADGTLGLAESVGARRPGPDSWSPSVPAHWDFVPVDELATLVEYGTSAKTNEDPSGIPVLRMGNIVNGAIKMDSLKYLPASHDEFPRLFLEGGDVLFNRTNSPELVGKTAVFRSADNAKVSFASYLLRVRLKPTMLPEFFSTVLNSVYGRAWVASVVSQQVGQANVNGTKLRALRLPAPSIEEQREIIAALRERLAGCERMVDQTTLQIARTSRLRLSVIAAALDGRLLGDTNPTARIDTHIADELLVPTAR